MWPWPPRAPCGPPASSISPAIWILSVPPFSFCGHCPASLQQDLSSVFRCGWNHQGHVSCLLLWLSLQVFCQRGTVDTTHSPGDGWPAALRTWAAPCSPLWDPSLVFWSFYSFPFVFVVVQSLSCVQLFVIPWTVVHQASLSFTISWSLLILMSIESMMSSNHLIFCLPLILLPSIFPNVRVFSSESALRIRWPEYWSSSFSISPDEYSGLISFRIDWIDLLAVQGSLKSLLHHYISKASVLWLSAFFMVKLSYLYVTTGKTIALTVWIFVGKVVSVLFNMLIGFVIVFLPRHNHLLTSWLQSPSAVILEPKKIKSVTVSVFSPCICHEVLGLDVMIFVFWMLSFQPAFSFLSFTFIKRLFSSSSAIRVESSAYLRLIFLPAILIPACDSSSLAFYMMYSA